ncbi:hypothetical protein AGMMS49944_32070 [Spirochaetia bacterium]|nr:hypothetical protein AGMMS49944_32070 [Spirochaetia bacterium]
MDISADIKIFDAKKVRTLWNEDEEEWYFSIVDVVAVLTDQETHAGARNYWKVLKNRLKSEGNETVTNCNQLKLLAPDGKMRLTDVANTQQLFRLIQSTPSPKAEPFKQWIAQIANGSPKGACHQITKATIGGGFITGRNGVSWGGYG